MKVDRMTEEKEIENPPSLTSKPPAEGLKIGFDLDGVICEGEVTRTPEECADAERSDLAIPSDSHEIYIVSSRTKNMEEETRSWLAKNEIRFEALVLCDADSFEGLSEEEIDRKQIAFKTEAVNELNLNAYVEDQLDVREHLRRHCPDCTVLSPKKARRLWGSTA